MVVNLSPESIYDKYIALPCLSMTTGIRRGEGYPQYFGSSLSNESGYGSMDKELASAKVTLWFQASTISPEPRARPDSPERATRIVTDQTVIYSVATQKIAPDIKHKARRAKATIQKMKYHNM